MNEGKWTPEPLRDDGIALGPAVGGGAGQNHTRFLVGGNDGEFPTVFVESACYSKADVDRHAATVDRLRDCYNALARVASPAEAIEKAREATRAAMEFVQSEYACANDCGELIPDPVARKVFEALVDAHFALAPQPAATEETGR